MSLLRRLSCGVVRFGETRMLPCPEQKTVSLSAIFMNTRKEQRAQVPQLHQAASHLWDPGAGLHGPLAARSPPVRCVRFIRLTRNSRSGDLGCSLSTQTLKRRVFEARAPRTSTIPLSSRLHLRTSGVAALRRKAASPRPLCGSDFFFLPYLFDHRLPLSIFHIVSWSYRFLLEA